jgi:hypothetical protein
MNSTEIKIGNLFQKLSHKSPRIPEQQIWKVVGIGLFHVDMIHENENPAEVESFKIFNYSDLHPIRFSPASASRFKRIYFPVTKYDADVCKFWLSVTNLKCELHFEAFRGRDEIVTTLKGQFCDLILDRISYLHELQNLYKILTKEEL